jgi:hypothetical protein
MTTRPRALTRKIDVEALPEPRWVRIEQALLDAEHRVWAPEVQPSPMLSLRAAGAMVLAAAVVVVLGAFAMRTFVQPALGAPTRVETAANGSHVEFGESTVDVGPESSVRLVGDDARGILVVVDRGKVECEVTPRHGRPPFLVQAGSVEVKVVGTHFVVTRTGSSATVDVQHGRVEVSSGEGRWLVGAGSHWPPADADADADPTPPAGPALAPAPTPALAPAYTPAPANAPAAVKSARTRYEAASRLEAVDPDAALTQYRALARHGGRWGQNALFAAGRLDADRGNREEARHLLLQYLNLYPGGANANDARELLDRMR